MNGQPLAKIEGANTYYYHNDHLGTPQKMTDSTGAVVWNADYKPFGEATITVNTITNNLRFPGQYYDAETGLNYNYYRDYNPVIGRYIEADPIGLNGGLNLFSYVDQNPVNWTDQWGLLTAVEIAQRVFRETAGLRPRRSDPNSEDMLYEARRRIAGIADKYPKRVGQPMIPDLNNPIESRVFNQALCAANNKIDPEKTKHFVIWRSADGLTPDTGIRDQWPYTETDKITLIYGPFRNTKGPDVYIFFYTGVR